MPPTSSETSKLDRRQLGKGIAAGVAAAFLPQVPLSAAVRQQSEPSSKVSQWTQVHPGVWKATIGTPEAVTPVSSRLVAPLPEALTRLPPAAQPPLAAPVATLRPRGVSLALPLEPYEEVYGFGLQFFSLQQRARKLITRVNADPKYGTGDTHAPVPFYVTSKGYGIFIDTARYTTFYCGEARDKPTEPVTSVGNTLIPTNTNDLYAKTLAASQPATMLIDVPACEGVDVYLFAGPTTLDAVRRYNLFSGGGANPPAWALGFWYRAQSNATGEEIAHLMQEFRDRRIPCDVVGLEPGWQSHAYPCTFAWKPTLYPDPAAFVQQMRAQDLHINLWEHAFTSPASPIFPALVPHSGDKAVWGGLVPDFQDPRARKSFGDFHGTTLIDRGISGFKLDECDNSDYTGNWSFPELSQFPSGVDGEQMHSLFGLRYQRALWEQFLQRSQPTWNLVRSSGALAAPYPFVLYSDLYDHRQFVRALCNSGFSGLLWCPEVRDAKSEEDLIRRLQTVVFSPLAMINGWYIPNPPWKQLNRKLNNANELMPHWESLEARCREILGWRMQLIPYLRAAFARYATDGTPPFRALALDWPGHPEIASTDDAFLLGDCMLVAPLFAGEPSRTLTLPPGDWHNFWTGERSAGGTKLQIAATEKNIPVFVKSGTVLPLATVTNSTADPASCHLEVRVFGDGHLPFTLKCPEGDTLQITWNPTNHSGAVKQSGPTPYKIIRWSSL